MSDSQYATPILISEEGLETVLHKIPVAGVESNYDEAFIQKIAFNHPSCLPIKEIDRAFEDLIPVCIELNTPAGPLDILYVTPKGRLVVVEAKLWRNPEARRKVIGQILDYAKELSRWDYDDLQREVSRSTGRKGNVLFDLVVGKYPETNEAEFVDEVTVSLKKGRFLLMILGDGIREGVGAIAEFLQEVGALEFTLGLVELALYRCPNQDLLIQPRVLAKTTIFNRIVISVKGEQVVSEEEPIEDEQDVREFSEIEKFYLDFWPAFIKQLILDDPSQPYPKSTGARGVIYFPMPPSPAVAWLSVYFSQKKQEVGVFLTFTRGELADGIYDYLLENQDAINEELSRPIDWASIDGKYTISTRRNFGNLLADEKREEIKLFLSDSVNRFVNVFRPRLSRFIEEHS